MFMGDGHYSSVNRWVLSSVISCLVSVIEELMAGLFFPVRSGSRFCYFSISFFYLVDVGATRIWFFVVFHSNCNIDLLLIARVSPVTFLTSVT